MILFRTSSTMACVSEVGFLTSDFGHENVKIQDLAPILDNTMVKKINKTHLGVYGIILDQDKILLIKKIRGPYTGKLDLPGGKIEHGEAAEGCLKREMVEETGMTASGFNLFDNFFHRVDFERGDEMIAMHHIGLVYKVQKFNKSELIDDINEEDVGGADWYDIKKLNREELSPFASYVVDNLNGIE